MKTALDRRSGCPINLTLEVLGDKWSLLVVRDIIFGNRRHYNELLRNSEEQIASNILAARLKTLVHHGILTRADDPTHKQKGIYSLTESGISLVPVLAQLAGWGRTYLPAEKARAARARVLADGGPTLWQELMQELRAEHLGARRRKPKSVTSVRDRLQSAYESAGQRRGGSDLPPF